MVKLTKQYLATRSSNIHTDESFSKALFEQILHAAEAQIEQEGADSVKLQNVEVEVRPYEFEEQGIVCAEVCIKVLGNKICKHVGV